jgi:hypothetical protein
VRGALKSKVGIGAACLVAAVGAGGAYAATNAADGPDALLKDAAERLDVSPQELRAALKGAFAAQLDRAVEQGRLTREQAEKMKRHGPPLLGGAPRFGGPHAIGFAGPLGLDAAAEYLGLSPAQLHRRLARGASLADVAKAEGKSVAGLEDALVAAAQERLDEAVDDGELTAEQRDELLEELRDHVDELVRHDLPGHRFHRHHGPGDRFEMRVPPPPGHGWR